MASLRIEKSPFKRSMIELQWGSYERDRWRATAVAAKLLPKSLKPEAGRGSSHCRKTIFDYAEIRPCWRKAASISEIASRASASIDVPPAGSAIAAACGPTTCIPSTTSCEARSAPSSQPLAPYTAVSPDDFTSSAIPGHGAMNRHPALLQAATWPGYSDQSPDGASPTRKHWPSVGDCGGSFAGKSSTAPATRLSSVNSASLWNNSFWAWPGTIRGKDNLFVVSMFIPG